VQEGTKAMARKKKPSPHAQRMRPVDEPDYQRLSSAHTGPLTLIAALDSDKGRYVFVCYWPRERQGEPEFLFDRENKPDELMGFVPAIQFIEQYEIRLRGVGLTAQINLLKRAIAGEQSYSEVLQQMRVRWAQASYHGRKDETRQLKARLGAELVQAETESPVPETESQGFLQLLNSHAKPAIHPALIILMAMPTALIIGGFLGYGIDNASPTDGAMAGLFHGLVLWLLIRKFGCPSQATGFVLSVAISAVIAGWAHYKAYSYMEEIVWEKHQQDYHTFLENRLEEDVGTTFSGHLKQFTRYGTTALEKPYMYLADVEVFRQGWEVWWAWARQVLHLIFWGFIGAYIGLEQYIGRVGDHLP
jgi:hypothetical protein